MHFLKWIKIPIYFYRRRNGAFFAIIIRGVKTFVSFKVEKWGNVELAQTVFDRGTQHGVNGMFVVKLNFRFGGMNIDVYGMWIHFQKKKISRIYILFHQAFIGG